MPPINDDDDFPQAAHAHAVECDCGCGIVSGRLFDNLDKHLAEVVFEPREWRDFLKRIPRPAREFDEQGGVSPFAFFGRPP
jgi:hypothetical protein